ncbi:MAG: CHAT domain-containing protein, partial [candidate division KSB1 bacterium]|nr:CHAT domain-containing protein [candidate division KSB1 bacterium]
EIFEDLAEALRLSQGLDEAVSYFESILKSNPHDAAAYYGLGNVYRLQERWEQALEKADKAMALNPNMYQAYYLKGWVCQRIAEYRKAIPILEAGLNLVRANNDFEYCAKFLRTLSIAYGRLGNYSEAFQLGTEAIKVFQEIGNKKWIETILGDLGMFYFEIGDYTNAWKYYEQAYTMACEINDKKDQARHLNNIGNISKNMGKYPEALEYFKRALAIDREVGNEWGAGIRLGNISELYCDLGDYLKAGEYSHQALMLSRRLGDRRSETINLTNTGNIYAYLNDYSKALEFYQQALKTSIDIGYRQTQATALEMIGDVYRNLGDYLKAKDYYEQARTLADQIGDKRLKGYILNSLGNVSLKLTDFTQSAEFHRQALIVGKELNEVNILVEAHTGLAMAYENQKKYKQALTHYQHAVEKIESVRTELQIEQHKLTFLATNIVTYERLINLLAAAPQKGYDKEAFHYAERAKSRALLDILFQGRAFHNLAELPTALKQKLWIAEKKLENKHLELSTELTKNEDARDKELVLSLYDEIESLQQARVQLWQELKEKYPRYYQLTNPRLLTAQEVQRNILHDKQVLVEYLVGDDRIFIWILTRQHLDFKTINLTRKELEARLAHISPIFKKEKEITEDKIDHRWANFRLELLHELYQLLLEKPAARFLETGVELIIVPDDLLYYFPFEILVTEIKGDKVHYLVESHPISYASSASLLNPELQKERKAQQGLLAFGNPDFGEEQNKGFMEWVSSLVPFKSLLRGNRFKPLPNAEAEVRAIAENFKGPAIFIGREATEERFKQMAPDFRFIHLATHHLTDDRQPMYSKIVLAQTGEETEDGYLQTYEVYNNLWLNADMVVLSGCNTGLGKLSRGEGLIGMTRAFLYAGVPSLVVSLWPVDDESTALLMKNFYQYLKTGLNKMQALQKAKLDLIKSNDWKQDPFYWGPFVLIGDGKAL